MVILLVLQNNFLSVKTDYKVIQSTINKLRNILYSFKISALSVFQNISRAVDEWLFVFFSGEGQSVGTIPVNSTGHYYVSDTVEWEMNRVSADHPVQKLPGILKKVYRWLIIQLESDDILFQDLKDPSYAGEQPLPAREIFSDEGNAINLYGDFIKRYYDIVSRIFLFLVNRVLSPSSIVFRKKARTFPHQRVNCSNSNQIRGPSLSRFLYFAPLFEQNGNSSNRCKRSRGLKPLQNAPPGRAPG